MIGCTGGVIRALLIRKWWWLDDALAGAKKTSWWEKCHHLSHRATIKKHFALFISSIISISHSTVEILLLQNVQNFFPKMHSEWLSFGIELLFVSGQSFKETQTVFSYRICQQSIQLRNALSAILKNKISGSTRWEENQTCLNLLPPLCTK